MTSKRLFSDLFCIFILLQLVYVIQSGTGDSLDLGPLDYGLYDEESLDRTIDDSDNDDSYQDLTWESKSYENIDRKSRVGRCSS